MVFVRIVRLPSPQTPDTPAQCCSGTAFVRFMEGGHTLVFCLDLIINLYAMNIQATANIIKLEACAAFNPGTTIRLSPLQNSRTNLRSE